MTTETTRPGVAADRAARLAALLTRWQEATDAYTAANRVVSGERAP